jgi:hypothetical protein
MVLSSSTLPESYCWKMLTNSKKITMKKLRGWGERGWKRGRGGWRGWVGRGGGRWERGAYWIPASAHKVARLYHSVKVCKFFAHC